MNDSDFELIFWFLDDVYACYRENYYSLAQSSGHSDSSPKVYIKYLKKEYNDNGFYNKYLWFFIMFFKASIYYYDFLKIIVGAFMV